ncbi:MAG: flavin prenyltransferase UbiX [Thiotrichales bacterium]
MAAPARVSLAMTGASGVQYGMRLLECLVAQEVGVDLMLSQPAQVVMSMETEWNLPGRPAEIRRELTERLAIKPHLLEVLGDKQWTAAVASGSGANQAMVVCPCTTGTLAAIATGQSRSLLERAADVSLKERKQLILVVRETPFSEIHLEHMLRLSRMGVVIMPANPGFYHRPQSIDDLVNFMVARILDHLNVPQQLVPSWGSEKE